MYFALYIVAAELVVQYSLGYFECPSGGYTVAVGCSTAQQCTPYTAYPVACINNACCVANPPSQTPSQQTPLICSNGGAGLVAGCSTSQQCLPFTTGPVACLQGICCTVPQQCPNGGRVVGLQCSSSESCVPLAGGCPVSCISGLCCTV